MNANLQRYIHVLAIATTQWVGTYASALLALRVMRQYRKDAQVRRISEEGNNLLVVLHSLRSLWGSRGRKNNAPTMPHLTGWGWGVDDGVHHLC
jgi:hypothetical protein